MRLRVHNIGGRYREYFGQKVLKLFHREGQRKDVMILPQLNLQELAMKIWTNFPGPEYERAAGFTNREMKLGHHENLGIMSYLKRHLSRSMLHVRVFS